jgi:N-acetylglutamate synthase-like GNAT family acetyltransferase
MTLEFRFGQEEDLDQIIKILADGKLPTEDVSLSKIAFIVALWSDEIVGCIGLEALGKHGLLRSMAVKHDLRGNGVGQQLYLKLLSYCMKNKITDIHLLTVDAGRFFESKGFVYTDRSKAPQSIKQTEEFAQLCPSSCSYMVRTLI